MKTDNNTTNQNVQDLNNQLGDLLDETKKVNQEIDDVNLETREEINMLDSKVDDSITKVEQVYSDLDKAEKEASDQLDKIVLQQAEDLASD